MSARTVGVLGAAVLVALTTVIGKAAPSASAVGQTKDSPVLIGGAVREPKRINTVVPQFPPEAKQGVVGLIMEVDPNGKVDSIQVRNAVEGATEAAIAAARQWQYEPVVQDGKAVWFRIIVGLPNPWPSDYGRQ